jgi:hypothetical protein
MFQKSAIDLSLVRSVHSDSLDVFRVQCLRVGPVIFLSLLSVAPFLFIYSTILKLKYLS